MVVGNVDDVEIVFCNFFELGVVFMDNFELCFVDFMLVLVGSDYFVVLVFFFCWVRFLGGFFLLLDEGFVEV